MSRIDIHIEDPRWRAAAPNMRALVRRAAELAAGPASDREVAILLTDDERLRALNAQFRGKDAPTNVLSFPAVGGDQGPLGDVALAFEICEREARDQGKRLVDHLLHLVIHGVLHLRGHDHDTEDEAAVMEGLERRLLARLGVADPYALESVS